MKDKKIKVCFIGCGNITNTRHIPAMKRIKNVELFGVIGNNERKVKLTAKKFNIKNVLILLDTEEYINILKQTKWFKEIEAIIIGTPPKTHYNLAYTFLKLNKNVLIEKPMTMNVIEAQTLNNLAQKQKKVLNVMHNFQYATGIMKLENKIKQKKLGEIISFCEFQFTNRNRRLPKWYDELPLGLFYDEAAHFFYLLEKFGGSVYIKDVYAHFNYSKEKTPVFLNVNGLAGNLPIQIFFNFNSPICEWYFIVCGTKSIAIYDFFKDILIILDNDNEHHELDVLKKSVIFTWQYWKQFFINGIKMYKGKLLYGHDVLAERFIYNIINNKTDKDIGAKAGEINVLIMNEVVKRARKEKC